ncbi:PTS system trehalose-specific IIB component, Glc family (TC 4.A.1.2.4)/PTS system trehalose-specific IIC component, Glc family (TC 4.A.1.2.4)/PTS system trehalose-specific IIA component, Glc family (TC 4.A.1.2.4) [Butyrivibrio fibrisolvens 16/4]|nr:PTS system trehalose-specific IIB component, Glc family (TC 4.A.1.2.4)/PTS system trehalose-specific IIC component, Glc family (TC 4.A.1.2.4)/PTS system trehalose-specific IIA component, Glc family (TC 4.A.1.2.4) [Butyrivibrio fibrisolvens 16/4]
MGKFTEQSKQLLELVGGKSNIAAVSHCVTRMRFVLNDPSKADVPAIEKIKGVKGTFTQAGQFQVIIGQEVQEFYNDFTAVSGVEGVSKDQVKKAAKQNQNQLQKIMSAIAEIFAPIIPALVVGGLILGFRNVIGEIDFGNGTIVSQSQFWAGVHSFLWLIGEAIFHMLPVGICWSITKKMGTTQILGIVLGCTLVSGQLLNAYGVAGAAADAIPKWDFGFAQVNMIGYQAQVIPAILAGFCLVFLERFFNKICPKVISMIVVPFFSLVLAVMASHFILGPIGWKIGSWISAGVHAGLTSSVNWLFAGVFGMFYAPLVITGLHHMTNAIDTQLVADFGGTILWPMIALSNIAQGSAVLGMIFLQKKNAKTQEVSIPACISCYLGVTEPAMFGVNLKYGFPFFSAMIGSCIAAVISVASGVMANSIGVGGIPGILSIQTRFMGVFALSMLVAIVVPFVLTTIVGKNRLSTEDLYGEAEDEEDTTQAVEPEMHSVVNGVDLTKVVAGTPIAIEKVEDAVFSKKLMGDGIGIIPSDETIYAPANGVVKVTMDDSKHAIGLKLDNGADALIHVGIDTVQMNGEGFEYLVEKEQKVTEGQPLLRFSKKQF